jgi:hypothetical protein
MMKSQATMSEQSDQLTSPSSEFLRRQFSSGLRANELKPIAAVAAMTTKIKGPTRAMKRSFPQLTRWFDNNWQTLVPIMPLIQLRDERNLVIDGNRELVEQDLIRGLI